MGLFKIMLIALLVLASASEAGACWRPLAGVRARRAARVAERRADVVVVVRGNCAGGVCVGR